MPLLAAEHADRRASVLRGGVGPQCRFGNPPQFIRRRDVKSNADARIMSSTSTTTRVVSVTRFHRVGNETVPPFRERWRTPLARHFD